MKKKIVVLAGDGIGPEIMNSAIQVLKKVFENSYLRFDFEEHFFGGAGIDVKNDPLPEETLAACKQADAILLGAIGGHKWETAVRTPEKGLLDLRKALNLFVNVRPTFVSDALLHLSPIKKEIVQGTDLVVIRELIGGIYFGEPRYLGAEEAYDTNRYNVEEIKRVVRYAFEMAQNRRQHVLSVDKANVLATSKLWRKVTEEVAKEFPDCKLEHQYVDAAAMRIIQNPKAFDVIVTENLFGDILSDEASVLPGTLGVLPSASHGQENVSLYEPIHGSAPDVAGKNIANPVSMILSASLMLRESFDMYEESQKIETACFKVMEEGVLTKDLGGTASTTDFTAAVITKLN
ncbi:3-isopropylmalate dehydrogenase [Tetragenococcus muriaticus]|uniref:3-isopropylmalate dehydrogenase n=1 Tax=Tetragenococcus muriaticus TaxID=64642 RepID=UPI00040BD97B|nr:3-isopropylmalate dehydrogenase [Tetragenococcus muriaticus]GMA46032.1 3-isopropylmalate dehydrogenase [Tetragenococcus muriaticus]GMA47372.1 3-isopropylmalate dehydrogenase [Tetragenococcus muriaticus]